MSLFSRQILHHPHKKYFAPALIGVIRETAKTLQDVDVLVNMTSVSEDFLYQVLEFSEFLLRKKFTVVHDDWYIRKYILGSKSIF